MAIRVPSTEYHVSRVVREGGDASNRSLRITAWELPLLSPRALHRDRRAQDQTAEGGSGGQGTRPALWAGVRASLLVGDMGVAVRGKGRHEGRGGADAKALMLSQPPCQARPQALLGTPEQHGECVSVCFPG